MPLLTFWEHIELWWLVGSEGMCHHRDPEKEFTPPPATHSPRQLKVRGQRGSFPGTANCFPGHGWPVWAQLTMGFLPQRVL